MKLLESWVHLFQLIRNKLKFSRFNNFKLKCDMFLWVIGSLQSFRDHSWMRSTIFNDFETLCSPIVRCFPIPLTIGDTRSFLLPYCGRYLLIVPYRIGAKKPGFKGGWMEFKRSVSLTAFRNFFVWSSSHTTTEWWKKC